MNEALIVADTTPLNYLVLIGAADLLPKLYGRVMIPVAVRNELSRPGTPLPVRDWLMKSPSWLEILVVTVQRDASLNHLDDGEIEAIALAEEHRADLVLIDERDGTIAARKRGLTVTGTLGVLDRAAASRPFCTAARKWVSSSGRCKADFFTSCSVSVPP